MSNVNYQESWENEATQCKNCKAFQTQDNKNACVPTGEKFENALKKYGELTSGGHCDYFDKK